MQAADVDLSHAMTLKPAAAIRYFESKGYAIGFNWHDVEAAVHPVAFTVAGILKQDVLTDVRDALTKALTEGETLRQFEQRLTPVLMEKGWLGRGLVADEDGVLQGKQLTPRRLKTIFQTNMQASYNAGRYEEQLANAEFRPYLERIAILDTHTRPLHAALHGFTARTDDPVWQFMYPPDGHGCRCRVRARSQADIDRSGQEVKSWADEIVTVRQSWGPDEIREVQALDYNGQRYVPDAGFGHSPRGNLTALGQRLLDRAGSADPRLASRAISDTLDEPAVRSAVTDGARKWVDNALLRQPAGEHLPVGALQPGTLDRLETAGVDVPAAVLRITDSAVYDAPGPLWGELPELLHAPELTALAGDGLAWVVNHDGKRHALRGIVSPEGIDLRLVNGGAALKPDELAALRKLTRLQGE
ncbi:phage head morphogenesis protein [Erwinia psidii]|uniref:phage head morphogenesis protein n=1 Tax=Erwinia psidii TaxID=69224 RepID=UPI00226BAA6F|nr:phage minor head protein [Erwinia psidii]MCX8962145.1 phage head morphogenesis protein [Erwinia psidii]